jgi:cellobiose phosphorylase
MEPGIAENGTIYSHLNIWMILGLLKYGMADRAYELFKKITPGYISNENDFKNECPPYMYSNCYFGPEHKNNKFQMEFTWITGSVAWYSHSLINYMIGAKAGYEGLSIEPCIPSEWDEFKIKRHYRGCEYDITVKNPHHLQHGRIDLTVDGKKIEGNIIPTFSDNEVHTVAAVIKEI